MPMPPMIDIATAPVRGNRSPTTASMVGQKNVLPIAYTASAIIAPANVSIPLTILRPITASTAQRKSRPIGESFKVLSMKSAQKRSENMSSDVNTKRILPCAGVRMLPVMF